MRIITVKNRQAIVDIAVEHCGSATAAMHIAVLNSKELTANLTANSVLILPEIIDKRVVDNFRQKNISPASQPPSLNTGIGILQIDIDFNIYPD